jgi:hypothetical protein
VCSCRYAVLLGVGLLLAGPALAEGETQQKVEQAFDRFAKHWLADLSKTTKQDRDQRRFLTPVEPGKPGEAPTYTYRENSGNYVIETKATGNAAAPFIGILSYTESVYTCKDSARKDCVLVKSSPITEIFPYRNGRWRY